MRHLALLLLSACAHTVPTVTAPPMPTEATDPATLSGTGPIARETIVAANWAVARKGLIDLKDPAASELSGGKQPMVLTVHVLTHPTAGTFLIDTGMPTGRTEARGLVRHAIRGIETERTLASILADIEGPIAGVLLTHTHIDHILGLPDLPEDVPVYVGPGDERPGSTVSGLAFPTFKRGLGDRPLTLWDLDSAAALGPVPQALDLVGDGSLWALVIPGHTAGSTAYLARTTDGPVLFTGDTSHTRWGWDHDVTPGTFTEDHEGNAIALAQLRALAASIDGIEVVVGHEVTP